MSSVLSGKNILVTGATGSFGHAFVRRALDEGARRVESKGCPKCGETKPFAAFNKNKGRPHGLQVWCRSCISIRQKQNRAVQTEKHLGRAAKWQKANPDRVLAQRANWREENRPRINASNKKLYDANPEHHRALANRNYAKHAPKRRAYVSAWQRANPEKKMAYAETRRARKANAVGRGITPRQWEQILVESLGLCAYCNERKPLTMDHIEPLSRGGEHDIDNAAAACRSCNSSKNGSPLLLWLARRALARVAA